MPSHIQAWSFAGLRSAKGSTAMLGEPAAARAGWCVFQKYQPTPGAPRATPSSSSATSNRPRGAPAFSTRQLFTSNAQDTTSVMGKPSPSAITVAESTQAGRSRPCITGSMIWRIAKAAIP